jgi:rhodanese-related sulfurtransferase
LPVIYRTMGDINNDNYEDLPTDKYIVCVDSIGLRARRAAQILYSEGYLTLYLEGGFDMFAPYLDDKLL